MRHLLDNRLLLSYAVALQLRQCEVLKREHDAGEELTDEENRKLRGMTEWQEELQRLET